METATDWLTKQFFISHSRSLVLCSVAHFCFSFEVCLWVIDLLEVQTMAHYKISSINSRFVFFLYVGI